VLSNEISRIPEAAELLATAIHDEHHRVRLEAVRGASFLGTAEGAKLALQAIEKPVDYWIDYTLEHTLLALRPAWLSAHVKGQFLTDVPPAQQKYFQKFLESLGPSVEAIPHLQVLASGDSATDQRDAAVEALTALKGDRSNGEVVFNRVCSACHRINNRGINFGPDLTQIQRRVKPQDLRTSIIHSIIEPNREIDKQYDTLQLLTVDGKVLNGFVESEDDQFLTLRAAGGKLEKIAQDDIEERIVSKVSSMPEGLGFSIAPAEFLDIVEYLTTLNK
jgi:putative heme-binding domain-containing protein